MALVPPLRVVPLSRVMRHEEVDPLRVEHLIGRIRTERTQLNPVICAEAPGGFVVLDGASRTEALKSLGLEHVVVQVVDPVSVNLETWHHVIRNCPTAEVIDQIKAEESLIFVDTGSPPRVTPADGDPLHVMGSGLSANATLSALVNTYVGRWTVSRIIDPAVDVVSWRFPDWSVIVEFPTMNVDQVLKAALGEDLLPAGVTRFLVPERVLRLNVDLALLEGAGDLAGKQEALDGLVQARSRAGRVRRYEETVVILDD